MRKIWLFLSLTFAIGATAQSASEPTGTITLDDAVRLALARNPSVAAAALEVDARAERAQQQSRRPNPALTAEVQNVGADTASRETTTSVQQLLELGGDRNARTQAALRARDVATHEYASARTATVAEVRRAFTSVVAAQQEVTIARENLDLAANTAAAVRARVEAGKTSPIEETRSDVLVAAERLELLRAEQHLAEARRRLAATWGGDRVTFDSAAGSLSTTTELPSLDQLQARLDTNSMLVAAIAVVAEREAVVKLEEARRIPDLTASAGYRRFSSPSDAAVVGGVALPLPLFDRNRGGIAEARLRVALERNLADAYRAYETARQEVTTLQRDIVPAAQSVFDAISEGYRLGKFGYLEVLDARRTLTTARLQFVRALEQLHLAVVSVEQLTAQPMTGETK